MEERIANSKIGKENRNKDTGGYRIRGGQLRGEKERREGRPDYAGFYNAFLYPTFSTLIDNCNE